MVNSPDFRQYLPHFCIVSLKKRRVPERGMERPLLYITFLWVFDASILATRGGNRESSPYMFFVHLEFLKTLEKYDGIFTEYY